MKYLWRAARIFLEKYKWVLIGALVSLLLANGASLIQPQFTRLIVDRGIEAGDMSIVIWLAVAMVVFAALRSVLNFAQGALMARVAQGLGYDMRNRIYEKIQALSFSYHDQAQTGQLMTRATSDVDMVQNFIGHGFLMVIGALVTMIGSIAFLFVTNWLLALVMLVILPIVVGIFTVVNKRIRPMFKIVQERLASLNTVLQESLAGVRVVKAFVREPYEAERFAAANQELYDINIKIAKNMAFVFPMVFLFSNLATLAVYWIGGGQVLRGTLTLGEMMSFANYMMMAFWPMLMVTMVITMLSQAGASAERFFEVVDAQSEVVDRPDALVLGDVQGRVVFENVSFRYTEHGDPVLAEVSLEAEPGQVIALLGATGSGKSTIINLIPRFYDVSEGRVTIDAVDVRDVTLESLRSQIGIVFQETTLFAGTIRENIAFGRSDASEDEIIAAAKAAEAHDFILEFPNGYDTDVAERGVSLSGGQKQRIAIARALVLNPHILILDDSTSSVDLETEYRIQQALGRLMEGRTSFVIAQRIATVLNADQILVLEQGRVVAEGKHKELMETSEIYAEIYHSQLLEGAENAGDEILAVLEPVGERSYGVGPDGPPSGDFGHPRPGHGRSGGQHSGRPGSGRLGGPHPNMRRQKENE